MSLLTNGQLAQDGDFRLKVKIAMVQAAVSVAAETETAFKKYTKRHQLAQQILNSPDGWVNAFAFGVAANVAITSASIDNDIEYTVNSLIDGMAGVRSSDATTAG